MNIPKDSFARVIFAGCATAIIGAFIFGFIGLVVGFLINITSFDKEVDLYTFSSAFGVFGFVLAVCTVIHGEITEYIKSKKNNPHLKK